MPGGLTGTSDSVSFIVDTSVPVVTVTEPAEGVLVASTTPTIAGACSEAAGTVHVNLTGASAVSFDTPCTAGLWSTTAPTLATGAYTAVASQTNGAGTTGTSPARNFQVDATAPTTTDNTATIGNAWRNTPATVTLTPVDAGGAGVGQTYYTTDGSTPTTASATGTSIELTADNVYTIKYFSVDTVGNTEAVKTAAHADPHRHRPAVDDRQHRGHRERLDEPEPDGHADPDGRRPGRRDVLHDQRHDADDGFVRRARRSP